jgi:TonB-dependent receptor
MSPRYLDLDKINQYLEKNPQYLTHNAATSLQNELANDKNAREQVFAGYAMGNMSLGPLSVLGGVRFEKTHLSGETAIQDPRAGLTLTDPIERTRAQWGKRTTVIREYRNVLPGIHFKYAPGKNWLTRASYSQSFGRPSFGSIYPDTRINYDAERITQNNTGVKPQDAANFDVTIERYFEPVGVISAGVFLKEIKNFIFSNVVKIPTGSDNGFDGEYAGWDLATQANGGFARIKGAELNYSQQLSFLPGFWKGFGVFANHTWLETTGNYGRVTETAGSALVNFTPRAANAGISYSRGRFYARVNVNYTGTYLRSYSLDPLSRSYQDRRIMVDTKLGFHYSRKLTFFTDVANIFNSKQKWYSGLYREYNTDQRDHGVRVQAGVNGSF